MGSILTPAIGAIRQVEHPDAVTAVPKVRRINAEHLRLALVARKVRSTTRWAAMSSGAQTSSCQRRQPGGGYFIHVDPLMSPLTAGRMQAVYDRVRSHGRAEVLRTWGASIAVLKVEFSTCVLRAPAAKHGAL